MEDVLILTTLAALTTAILLVAGSAAQAQAPAGYEREPVFNAQDLAGPDLLKGPHFTIDPKVPIKGSSRASPSGRPSARSKRTGSACYPSG